MHESQGLQVMQESQLVHESQTGAVVQQSEGQTSGHPQSTATGHSGIAQVGAVVQLSQTGAGARQSEQPVC
ncbi:MAG: hypothetical protein R3C11_06410 [Planctomycetaceae bacterium]